MQNANVAKKWKNKRKEKQRGITLIALVITIIVLLILAAVSIATLTGENGILTKASKAKEETETASKEEQRRLAVAEANMNDTETIFQGVKIPAKCAPTKIEGESTVDEGLVMVDSNGNSYVWIEVPKTAEIYTTATTSITNFTDDVYGKIEKDLQTYASDYRDTNYSDTWYKGCGINSDTEYKTLKNTMLKSVYENEGFWIGQYEVGYEQGVEQNHRGYEIPNSEEEFLKNHPIEEIPVIRANVYPYNWVTCRQAQQLASGMNSGNYTSSLMFGIQWDLMLKFIEEKRSKTSEELKNDSSSWGNYKDASFTITKGKYSTDNGVNFIEVSGNYKKETDETNGVLLTTGATKRNSALNIYDIAGNVREWTLEKYVGTTTDSDKPCINRGGDYLNKSNDTSSVIRPVKYRSYYQILDNRCGFGFRTMLYV